MYSRKKPYDPSDLNVKPWTGFGYMQVNEGSELVFDKVRDAIFKDMDYDLVIRHDHHPDYPLAWEKATVQLITVGDPINPNGTCKDAINDPIEFVMNPEQTFTVIEPPLCLEEGQQYKIKFTFDQYQDSPDPAASIYIDSVSFQFLIKIIPNMNESLVFVKIC